MHFANDNDFSTKESQIVDTRFPRVDRLRCLPSERDFASLIYNMNGKQQDFKRRKRKPERRCIGVYHEANAVEWKCAATVIAFYFAVYEF